MKHVQKQFRITHMFNARAMWHETEVQVSGLYILDICGKCVAVPEFS